MKKNRIFLLLSAAIIAAPVYWSCQKDEIVFEQNPELKKVSIGENQPATINLIAGQNMIVGTVSFIDIDTDGVGGKDALRVTYQVNEGVIISDVSFWIGSDHGGLPRNKSGNPVVGHFPYKTPVNGQITSIVIQFSDLGYVLGNITPYTFAAQANVLVNSKSEGAWGEGFLINPKGNWGMYNVITIAPDDTQSSFGISTGGHTFAVNSNSTPYGTYYAKLGASSSAEVTEGWTNKIQDHGTYNYNFYRMGTDGESMVCVGKAVVVYSTSGVDVDFELFDGCEFINVRVYVGATPLPVDNDGNYTTGYGKFTNKGTKDFTEKNIYSESFTDYLSGEIYFIGVIQFK